MGFLFVPINVLGTAPLRRDQIGTATGVLNLVRNVGGSVGIAWVSTMLARRSQVHQTMLGQNLHPSNHILLEYLRGIGGFLLHAHAPFGNSQYPAFGAVYLSLLQQAALLSFVDVFEYLVLVALGAILIVALMGRTAPPRDGVALH
jgi:DHA2 family multidrug resistance protein